MTELSAVRMPEWRGIWHLCFVWRRIQILPWPCGGHDAGDGVSSHLKGHPRHLVAQDLDQGYHALLEPRHWRHATAWFQGGVAGTCCCLCTSDSCAGVIHLGKSDIRVFVFITVLYCKRERDLRRPGIKTWHIYLGFTEISQILLVYYIPWSRRRAV